MKRILVVYNPNSSQYIHVKSELLSKLPQLKSAIIGKFTIEKAPFESNVVRLRRVLKDGDFVLAAGGDATAAVAVNAIMLSGRAVTLSVLPYGNFNDLARTLGTMRTDELLEYLDQGPRQGKLHVRSLYPLDILVDNEHWRFASCYVTMGMTADAVALFDDPAFRKKMQRGHRSSWRSYLALIKWYFKFRHSKVFIPPYSLNGQPIKPGISDYCALSGRSMCRVMKGGDDYLKPRVFRSASYRLISFWKISALMLRSIFARTPGTPTTSDTLTFATPATITLQAEGEYRTFENVHTLRVVKSPTPIKVIHE